MMLIGNMIFAIKSVMRTGRFFPDVLSTGRAPMIYIKRPERAVSENVIDRT